MVLIYGYTKIFEIINRYNRTGKKTERKGGKNGEAK
jgi:hypothetical protein